MYSNKIDQALYTGSDYADHRSFWEKTLSEVEQPFTFPKTTTCINDDTSSALNARAEWVFSKPVQEKIDAIAGGSPVGTFVVVGAVLNFLLSKYTEGSVILRMPTFLSEGEELPVNHELPFIFSVSGINSLKELIGKQKEAVLNLHQFQDYPIQLADANNMLEVNLSNVFVSMEGVHNAAENTQHCQLSFSLSQHDQNVKVEAQYNDTFLNEGKIEWFLKTLELALEYLDRLDTDLSDLPYLFPEEEKELIEIFNQGTDIDERPASFAEAFQQQAIETPDNIALSYEGVNLTYKEVNEKANQLARYLTEDIGVEAGDFVAVRMKKSERLIIGLIAILKSGAAYVPIDPSHPEERMNHIFRETRPKTLFIDSEHMMDIGEFEEAVFVMDLQLDSLEHETTDLDVLPSPETACYVIYTSGTTGTPKGVVVKHKGMANTLLWRKDYYEMSQEDVALQLFSAAFDGSITDTFTILLSGGKLVVPDEELKSDTQYLAKLIAEHSVTNFIAVPSFYKVLLEEIGDGLKVLKHVTLAGEAVVQELINAHYHQLPDVQLVNEYGPTENTVCSTAMVLDPEEEVNIGSPIDHVKVYILDESQRIVPLGAVGEICLGGIGVAAGYLHREELTAEKFIADPFNEGALIYRTGDKGRWVSNGEISYLGRGDHQVKVRGFRIELAEVENVIRKHPAVQDVVVDAQPNEVGENQLSAYAVSGGDTTEDEYKEFLHVRLPDYMVPSVFMLIEEIPLTTTGKIDRKKLRQLASTATSQDREIVAPSTETEQKLAEIWQVILSVDEVGIHDNFFMIGGHSLKATQVVSRIHKAMNVDIDVKAMFSHPTIAELAVLVEEADTSEYNAIQPVAEQEFYDISHAQRRLWILDQIDESKVAYNIPSAYVFSGDLNVAALEKSFEQLINRHESLRTSIVEFDGKPVQVIRTYEELGFGIDQIDLSTDAEKESKAHALADQEARNLFDLSKDPLLRVKLVKLEEKKHVVLFTMHHIIADAWSIIVLVNELIQYYEANLNGQKLELPPLSIQYKEYAHWQNEQLKDEHNAHRQYWLEQFTGEISVLDMPTDFPRPDVRTSNGSHLNFRLEQSAKDNLNALSQENGVSLFMTILALVNTLLYRYTGQRDIVIGSPIAGRDHHDLENQIGFYVNTLALRTRFEANDSFQSMLEKVKQTTLQAYEHQIYPFDKLVDDLDLERDMSRSPLFDVNVALQNAEVQGVEGMNDGGELAGLEVEEFQAENDTNRFDLVFNCVEFDDYLSIHLEYNTDIFRAERMEMLSRHFINLVESIIAKPQSSINQIAFIDDDEKSAIQQVLTGRRRDSQDDLTVLDLFKTQVNTNPGHTALTFGEESWTYRELDEESNRIAHFLKEKGVGESTLVGFVLDNSAHAIQAILGILKCAAGYLPLRPDTPIPRLRYMLNDAGVEVFITEKKYIKVANQLQWECDRLHSYLCLDSQNVLEEAETANELMSEELWDYVGENAHDDISGGGWVSSYTGEDLSAEEMKEYADNVLEKVKPYLNKEARVLEIGCASGISMFSIAPHVSLYYGTDLSGNIIRRTAEQVSLKGIQNIKLEHMAAHQIDTLDEGGFDLVIINSVIQSFAGHNYLRDVIGKVIDKLSPQGHIFLGDLQDQDLKYNLISSLQAFSLDNPEFASKTKTDWSNELFISRNFLDDLRHEFKAIKEVEHSTKLGEIKNELTQFRFDCILGVDKSNDDLPAGGKSKQQYGRNDISTIKTSEELPEVLPMHPSYLIYTSGSTGQPKGVAVNHASLYNYIAWAGDYYFDSPSQGHMALITSLSFDLTVTSTFLSLARGNTLHVHHDEDISQVLLESFTDKKVDTVKLTPTHISLLKDMDLQDTQVKRVIAGGEALRLQHLQILQEINPEIKLYNEYGPTEATVGCTVSETSSSYFDIGRPIDNTNIHILDDNLNIQPTGYVGEIGIEGDCLAMGYWNNFELTEQKFIDSPFNADQRIYQTGDLGLLTFDGELKYLGRLDDQVKVRGYRVELGEVEKVLSTINGIEGCAVIATEDVEGTSKLIAYYTGDELESIHLHDRLAIHLPDYMVPSLFFRLEEMPLDASGKLSRKKLHALEASMTAAQGDGVQPQNEDEKALLAIWEFVLERSGLGVTDNFFEIGGHSLKATRIVAQIYKQLGVKIRLRDVFQQQTIRALAQKMSAHNKQSFVNIPKAEIRAHYPLSHAQRRLWILCESEEDHAAYNMPGAYVLEGKLDRAAFSRSFESLMARHESLRTTFTTIDGEPRQVVHDLSDYDFKVAFIDLRQSQSQNKEARAITTEEVNKPFELSRGPLVSVSLIQMADEEHILLMNLHHIISDGWSMGILVNEVQQAYNQLVNGQQPQKAPLNIHYKDYAVWEEQYLNEEQNESHRSYWLSELEGPLPRINVDVDFERPALKTYNGSHTGIEINKEVTDGLKSLANKQGASLFITIQALTKLFLFLKTGDKDIIVGSPVSGREHPDLEEQIGFYANTLALRTKLDDGNTFKELLDQVRDETLQAYDHQLYPFDKLASDLNLDKDRSRSPVFDVMVQLLNTSTSDNDETLDGLTIRPYGQEFMTSKFDLSFLFFETEDSLLLDLEYNTDLYKEGTAFMINEQFKQLVMDVIANPEKVLNAYELKLPTTQPLESADLDLGFNADLLG
ncbi:MAG: amino acid adenylation domain-containing protein [Bacteroidota bacterium]